MKINLESLQKFLKELFIIYVLFLTISVCVLIIFYSLFTGTNFGIKGIRIFIIERDILNVYFLIGLLILSLTFLYLGRIYYLLRKPIKKIKDFFSPVANKASIPIISILIGFFFTIHTLHQEISQKDIEGTCEEVVIDIWEEYKEDLVDSKIPYGYLKAFCRQSAIEFFSNFEEALGIKTARNFFVINQKEVNIEHAFKFGTLQPLIKNNILTNSELCEEFRNDGNFRLFYPYFIETCG